MTDPVFHEAVDDLLPDELHDHRRTLEPVRQALRRAGYWAYGTLDDRNQWTIAVDDEIGRVDVRLGSDGFELELRVASPGLYADEESPWRQQSRARLARLQLPRITRGFLDEHQHAEWDETEQGIALIETIELPFHRADDIPDWIRCRLPELEQVLTGIERQLG